ncbi:MAG TPA: hypothetical protein VIV57_20775 [Anaeromyxobacter sp.]
MSRPNRAREALAILVVLAAGCQDYNFNPVGHCVIQPGSERVTLSSISTADVLFVVDDSGSMGAEQQALADNFTAFIQSLDDANAGRVANGLEPFDFHIAVTSTSVFWNYQTNATCRSDCPDAPGKTVCCNGSVAARQPKACTPGVTACPGTTTCSNKCAQLKGEFYCCDASGAFPPGSLTDVIPCSNVGAQCGTFERHYNFGSCVQGVGADQWPYPQGDFVSWTSATAANPRVLHFDKELYTGTKNRQGFNRTDLIGFFKGGTALGQPVQGNVITGTCGSGEEQGLSAARLALEKAVAGQQKDTYDIAGSPKWDSANRVASASAEWLHPNAKLVLVFVGDEDDCSSPADPAGGIVMQGLDVPGSDACTRDPSTNPPVGDKLYDVVTRFVDYFTGLGRPVGAAFIESAAQTSCSGDQCTPGTCCQQNCGGQVCGHDSVCGGQAAANRFFRAAGELRGRGIDVVEGSICDPDFGTLLAQIAELVKPPSGLSLPTKPAESAITVLRIADTSGRTRKVCGRPLAAASYPSLAAAQATGADWWFTAVKDVTSGAGAWNPVAVSQFVYINPQGSCIANPGETYSADYLGQVPAGGCGDDAGLNSGDDMCARKLGGSASDWTCYAGANGGGSCATATWNPATGTGTGTCICGSRINNCGP